MNINVVTVRSGWILQKIAERTVTAGGPTWFLSHTPRNDVDANLYMDVQNCYHKKTNTVDIGYFTHVHENDMRYVNSVAFTLDHIIHMCSKYEYMFRTSYPKDRMTVIRACEIHEQFKLKKPVIGIVQRGLHEGKGYNFMLDLVNYEILRKFIWIFVGTGWDNVVCKLKDNDVSVHYHTNETYNTYYSLYSQMDYLLIPSLWEGGPMSIIDAYGMGIPIISSNVGWVTDIGVEHLFEPNNKEELYNILSGIYNTIKFRRDKIEQLTYSSFVNRVKDIVENL